MRKMSKVALAATAVLALGLVFAAGSASAEEVYAGKLCKSAPASHSCPAADVYGAGTEISASLSGVATFSSGGSTIGQCTEGTQRASLGEEGGRFSQFSFSGCGVGFSATFKNGGFEWIKWINGTHNGVFPIFMELETHQAGVTCKWLMSTTSDEEVLGGSSATLVVGSPNNLTRLLGSSFVCPLHETLTGSWTVTSPSPLYVEKA